MPGFSRRLLHSCLLPSPLALRLRELRTLGIGLRLLGVVDREVRFPNPRQKKKKNSQGKRWRLAALTVGCRGSHGKDSSDDVVRVARGLVNGEYRRGAPLRHDLRLATETDSGGGGEEGEERDVDLEDEDEERSSAHAEGDQRSFSREVVHRAPPGLVVGGRAEVVLKRTLKEYREEECNGGREREFDCSELNRAHLPAESVVGAHQLLAREPQRGDREAEEDRRGEVAAQKRETKQKTSGLDFLDCVA